MSGPPINPPPLRFARFALERHIAALLGIAAAWAPPTSPASAAEPHAVCTDARVRVQGRLHLRWQEALTEACAQVRALSGSDPSARLRIASEHSDMVLDVQLKDGRTATRRLNDPERLASTMEALFALPTELPLSETKPPPLAAVPPPQLTAELPTGAPTSNPTVASAASAGLRFEIGALAAARVSGRQGYQSLGGAGLIQLQSGHWLLALTLRWDVVELNGDVVLDDFEMESSGAGIAIARRFH